MTLRSAVTEYPAWDSAAMSGTSKRVSEPIELGARLRRVSWGLSWTNTASVIGAFDVEESNSLAGPWISVPLSQKSLPAVNDNAGPGMARATSFARYARLVYTNASGTGTLGEVIAKALAGQSVKVLKTSLRPSQLMAGVEQSYLLRPPYVDILAGTITAVVDESGNAHNLAFLTNAPTLRRGGIDGRDCAELASNQKLTVAGLPYVLGDDIDVYAVIQFADTLPFPTTEAFWFFDGQHKLVSVGTTTNYQSDLASVNNGFENLVAGGLAVEPQLVATTMYGDQHSCWLNGVETAGAAGHGGIHAAEGSFTLGDLGSVTHTYRIAELVVVRNAGNDADRIAYQDKRVRVQYPSIGEQLP